MHVRICCQNDHTGFATLHLKVEGNKSIVAPFSNFADVIRAHNSTMQSFYVKATHMTVCNCYVHHMMGLGFTKEPEMKSSFRRPHPPPASFFRLMRFGGLAGLLQQLNPPVLYSSCQIWRVHGSTVRQPVRRKFAQENKARRRRGTYRLSVNFHPLE